MRIAMIAPIGERVPPKKYGGTERIIYALTEELVKRGHEVTLFASGDSLTSAKLVSIFPKGLREAGIKDPYGANHWTMLNIGNAYKNQHKFDIIHDHNVYFSLPTALLAEKPVVMTLHGAVNINNRRYLEELNNNKNPFFVSISHSQTVPLPDLNYVGNVYHGLDMQSYPFSSESDDYLLFVGRISPEKGVDQAIEVAEFLNKRLIIAAKVDPADYSYFEEKIKPHLSNQIRWIGEVDQEERNRLMSRAYAFLHPVTWREPFGLALIEAMGCGCPVLAYRRGSIPEIVKHGKTGFIVEDVGEMIEYIPKVKSIKREYCRKYALNYFNAKRMTDEYEDVYEKVVEKFNYEKEKMEQYEQKRPLRWQKGIGNRE